MTDEEWLARARDHLRRVGEHLERVLDDDEDRAIEDWREDHGRVSLADAEALILGTLRRRSP